MDYSMTLPVRAKLFGFIRMIVAIVMSILIRKVVISPVAPCKADFDDLDDWSDYLVMSYTLDIIPTICTIYRTLSNPQSRYNRQSPRTRQTR